MYRILLGCINSPDLTMHFRLGLIMIVRELVLLSHFNFVDFFGLSKLKEHRKVENDFIHLLEKHNAKNYTINVYPTTV